MNPTTEDLSDEEVSEEEEPAKDVVTGKDFAKLTKRLAN